MKKKESVKTCNDFYSFIHVKLQCVMIEAHLVMHSDKQGIDRCYEKLS